MPDVQIQDLSQFHDGLSFLQIMNNLCPGHFDLQDLEVNSESWIHRFQNLQQFKNQLNNYYVNVLNQEISTKIDLMKIAKQKDRNEIMVFIELILGALIQVS